DFLSELCLSPASAATILPALAQVRERRRVRDALTLVPFGGAVSKDENPLNASSDMDTRHRMTSLMMGCSMLLQHWDVERSPCPFRSSAAILIRPWIVEWCLTSGCRSAAHSGPVVRATL